MKKYINLLWIKYRTRVLALAAFLSIFTLVMSFVELENSFKKINEARAFSYLEKKDPEFIEKAIESVKNKEETDSERIDIELKFENEIRNTVDELNKSRKKITTKDIIEIKSSYNNEFINSLVNKYNRYGAISQIKIKEGKIVFDTYTPSILPYLSHEKEKEDTQAIIDRRTDIISSYDSGSPINIYTQVLMTIILTFYVAGNLTSLESMSRYKLFEESLPISKAKKYLCKVVFTILVSVVFFTSQILTVLIIYKISPYSAVIDSSGLIIQSIKYLSVISSISMIFMFIGNYCGNIVSYIGSIAFALAGAVVMGMAVNGIILGLYPEKEYYLIYDKFLGSVSFSIFSPFAMMIEYELLNIANFPLVPVIKLISSVVLITVLGAYISKHTQTERNGMFYNVKIISKIYYILGVFISAGILLGIFMGGSRLVNIIIFIISLAGFGKLYSYFFKSKLSF